MDAVRREVQAIDPDQPVFNLRMMDQMMQQQMAGRPMMPYGPVQPTGYYPGYNYYGAMPMMQNVVGNR